MGSCLNVSMQTYDSGILRFEKPCGFRWVFLVLNESGAKPGWFLVSFFLGGFKHEIPVALLRWGKTQVNGMAGKSIIHGTPPPPKKWFKTRSENCWVVATQRFFIFTPNPVEMIQFDLTNIFQGGWFNHQPDCHHLW